MIWRPNCCKNSKTEQYEFINLVTFGRQNINQLSLTPLPDKEEYTTYAHIFTIKHYAQHVNKNFSNTPLDWTDKFAVRYDINTAKIQNDWYVLHENFRLRLKGIINVDLQNKYLIWYLKKESV
jgi:hypothetical protein